MGRRWWWLWTKRSRLPLPLSLDDNDDDGEGSDDERGEAVVDVLFWIARLLHYMSVQLARCQRRDQQDKLPGGGKHAVCPVIPNVQVEATMRNSQDEVFWRPASKD